MKLSSSSWCHVSENSGRCHRLPKPHVRSATQTNNFHCDTVIDIAFYMLPSELFCAMEAIELVLPSENGVFINRRYRSIYQRQK